MTDPTAAATAALQELRDQIIAGQIEATSQETAYINGALAAVNQIRSGDRDAKTPMSTGIPAGSSEKE